MVAVGDLVQVPSKRVGQAPRDGVVTGVSGSLLRVTWSGGEESTIFPSMGSVVVVGKVRVRPKKAAATTKKAGSKKAVSKKAANKIAKATTTKATTTATKRSGKSQGAGATKSSKGPRRAGKHRK